MSIGITMRWWRNGRIWIAAAIGVAAIVWVARDLDYRRFYQLVAAADPLWLAMVPIAVIGEQWARAVKWGQLLHDLKPVHTVSLFRMLMASYFANLLVPGISSIARAWLAARHEGLKVTAVLATVAMERLIGGIVLTALVPFILMAIVVPDPTGVAQSALVGAAASSFALFALLLVALAAYRMQVIGRAGWVDTLSRRLPVRVSAVLGPLALGFAEGVLWPKDRMRRVGIVLASLAMKLIAATQLLWAGLAVGVQLPLAVYLFLLVFLSILHAFSISARMLGGFTIGAVIALGLFHVAKEQALAMALMVQGSSLLTVAALGGFHLWRRGIGLSELRAAWLRTRNSAIADLPAPAASQQR